MFSDEQKRHLSAKLDPKHVAERAQAGRKLSYIEGWHAIAEANRIFGFDAWTRETLEVRMVSERERKVGNGEGWGVSYVARVRVTVGEIVREGVGAGHGIDRDLGLAHESAIKEAETDAMKRALMTFGNPFGLALYDKTQSSVGVDAPEPNITPDGRKRKAGERLTDDADIRNVFDALVGNIHNHATAEKLTAWAKGQAAAIGSLPDAQFDDFMSRYDDALAGIRNARAAA